MRSWLTGISSAKFTQTLGYSGLYGGDIKTMSWTANGSSHSYTFGYDGVGRMMNANHGAGAYSELVTSYDKNGNIKALKRTCGSSTLADDLTYTYSGNRITKVEDAAGTSGLFSNGSTATTEYTYDNNGNLTKDLNKGISNITYNCLNLPLSMTFSNGSTIAYTYDANGRKLRTVHNVGGTTTTTDYAGNVIYENGVQKKLLTEEGYVDLTSGTYYYYLKDHQGNNRVVVNGSGAVQETNHYYPFGGTFASGTVQPYKYNGKELDTKGGLNWYDYGARHYDAALGRFLTVDPLAEKMMLWSPYGYCLNNPIKYVDKDGEVPWLSLIGAVFDYGFQVYDNYQKGKSGYDAWVGEVNFVSVGLSAINPAGKFKLLGTVAVEGLNATVGFIPNKEFIIKSDIEKIIGKTVVNTAINVGAGKITDMSSNQSVTNVSREMQKANQGVRKAQNQVNRHPNSEKSKTMLDNAKSNAIQVRNKQVATQMLNSTIGSMNSDVVEGTITNVAKEEFKTIFNWDEEKNK